MIRLALAVEDNMISGGPGWIDSEGYDIDAKTGDSGTLEPERFRRLLLALLEDRFQLKFHRVLKELPIYVLEVQKNGAKLKRHLDASEPSMSTNSQGTRKVLKATKISMQTLAGTLTRQSGRPVQDHTGLAGDYDVELEWDSGDTPESGPSIFTALQEQLGLRLNPAKGSADAVVIDHVEKPSSN